MYCNLIIRAGMRLNGNNCKHLTNGNMASQNYLVIRLEPHYQQFLRCHFQCEAEIFEFPHRHRFNSVLEDLVARRPYGYVEPAVDDWTFRIALPTFNRKNSTHFRYLTKEMETIFKAKIKGYYDDKKNFFKIGDHSNNRHFSVFYMLVIYAIQYR